MKKALLAALSAIATATVSFAGTWTWTGDGPDLNYYTPQNWTAPDGATATWPNANDNADVRNDTVEIDGNFAVVDNASREMPAVLILKNGASYTTTGEIQFNKNPDTNPLLKGGAVTGTMISAQGSGYISAEDCAITITDGRAHNGFWQNGNSYLNIVTGERKGSFTYLKSIAANPYWFFSHTKAGTQTADSPCIRLDGEVIDEDTFNDTFEYQENGDYITLSFAPMAGWRISAGAAQDVDATSATLTATVKSVLDGSNGYIYYTYGTSRSEVEDALTSVAALTQYSENPVAKDDVATVNLTDLATSVTHYYAFALVSGGTVVATTSVFSFLPTDYDNIYDNGEWSNGTPIAGQRLLVKDSITLTYNDVMFAAITIDVGANKQATIANNTAIRMSGALTIKSGAIRPVEGYQTYVLAFGSLIMDGGECELSDPKAPVVINAGSLKITNAGKINFANEDVASRYTINGGSIKFEGSEIRVGNATFRNAIITASGYTHEDDGVTLTARNTQLIATSAPGSLVYGIWPQNDPNRTFFNLEHTAPTANTYYPAMGYTYMYAALDSEAAAPGKSFIYSTLFSSAAPTFKVGGVTVDEDTFNSIFEYSADTEAKTVSITSFDVLDRSFTGDVTMMDGAHVKLTDNVSLSSLTMLGANSILDLNGHTLKLSKKGLTINGTNYEALDDFASTQVVDTATGGSVSYAAAGLVIVIR